MTDYRIVPAVATQAMHEAWLAGEKNDGESLADTDWRVMLAAAPAIDYDAMAVEVLRHCYPKPKYPHKLDVAEMSAALRATFEREP